MLKVSGSISTKTGAPPDWTIAFAEAEGRGDDFSAWPDVQAEKAEVESSCSRVHCHSVLSVQVFCDRFLK